MLFGTNPYVAYQKYIYIKKQNFFISKVPEEVWWVGGFKWAISWKVWSDGHRQEGDCGFLEETSGTEK